jgi:TRAP-type C4-dicarboxylate transport system substrate-binding protein
VVNLKFSSFTPPAHPVSKVFKELAKEMTETSNGKVVVKYYGSGALGKAIEHYDITVEGLADLALSCCGYTASRFPLSLGTQLPFFTDTATTGAQVLTVLWKKGVFNEEFKDVKYLIPLTTSPSNIFSKKKITRIEDFNGLRIVGGTGVFKDICDILGATAMVISYPEVYLALQRSVIDAVAQQWTAAVAGYKWHEVVKYAIDISIMSGWHCSVIMNKKSWNKIPADVRSRWEKEVFPKYPMKVAKLYDGLDGVMRQKAKKERPEFQIIQFPESEKRKLAEKFIPVWQKWVEKNGDKAKRMYKLYVSIMKKIGKPVLVKLPGLYQD